jgi:hypothetical integral membrane protein (TIGR02206 family)
MSEFFAADYTGRNFVLFSPSHIAALITIIVINCIIFLFRKRIQNRSSEQALRYILASVLILQEISYDTWYAYIGKWSIASTLPLHLCGISVILSAIMLVTKSYPLFEIVYFWGVGGATQALLTPDIGVYGFPHYRFFQFFISHGAIVTACLFGVFIFNYRPTLKSLKKAFAALNIYMVFIAGFNALTGGNYLFISSKPSTASLMDYLGPWPWYILSLDAIAVLLFFIIYIPFWAIEHRVKMKASRKTIEVSQNAFYS